MFAVIESGGKQIRVAPQEIIKIEKIMGQVGEKFVFDRVLLMHDGTKTLVGNPTVQGAQVEGTILGDFKCKKVVIYKYKKRKGYHKKQGHRQQMTSLRITDLRPPVASE